MRNRFPYLSTLLVFFAMGAVFGISIYEYKMFPYRYIKKVFHYIGSDINPEHNQGLWSIGIYTVKIRDVLAGERRFFQKTSMPETNHGLSHVLAFCSAAWTFPHSSSDRVILLCRFSSGRAWSRCLSSTPRAFSRAATSSKT